MMLVRSFLIGVAALLVLTGCTRPTATNGDDDNAALRAAGYSRAPQITGVEQGGGDTYIVTGVAMPDGRVRFDYGGSRAIGVTADAKGRFRAPLPAGPDGGLYDVSTEDNGRLMHAEGRLFIPSHRPDQAVLIRAGAPSLPLLDKSQAIAVVDFDAAGAIAISGHIATQNVVDILIDGDIRAQVRPDADHGYSALSQIAPPSTTPTKVALEVRVDGKSEAKSITVSLPQGEDDQISLIPGGWRVDARLPGGGMQTTLIF